MNFDVELKERTVEIENIILKYLPKEEGVYKNLMEAMNYSVLAGGKRLRPMLMLETFRLFGGKTESILYPFMAAIEMIHTYSLVHDDLPALDNDELRRGRKTTHVVYGEALAILAGDGLLTYAFETVSKAFEAADDNNDNADSVYKRILKAINILAKKAGIHGMIGGQVIDIESEGNRIEKDTLDLMYRLKTGALIQASMMIGAILAGAKEEEIRIIESIAEDIGLAFQIRDDILDVISDNKTLGKPVHSDEKNEKCTYVSLMDIEQAKEEVAKVTERAIKAYKSLPYENEFLEKLIVKLINRDK
ncbi:MAG TPA: polyprenyl synthetase family protein [Mobilitalea sp.]|nr:polyprenyl synthetase family protein [Mobilitalea sp.]